MKRILIVAGVCFGLVPCILAQNAETETPPSGKKVSREVEIPGNVISLRGDSVSGIFYERRRVYGLDADYIEITHPDVYYKYVIFKPDQPFLPEEVKRAVQKPGKGAKKAKYTPVEIQGFRLSNSEFVYQTLMKDAHRKHAVFARLIEQGSVSLYSRRMPSTRMPQSFILKKEQELIFVKSGDKPEKIAGLFQDDPATYSALLKGDYTYTYESLIMLVRTYNASGKKTTTPDTK